MLTLTASAIKEVKSYIESETTLEGTKFLRFGLIVGGCSGFTYSFSIDNAQKDNDVVLYDVDGLKVVTDQYALPMISGSELDFKKTLTGAGLVVNNPNASRGCGCGKSFDTQEDLPDVE